jgi:hypothetical protein
MDTHQLYRLSLFAIIVFLSTIILNAQTKIKERMEIAPKQSNIQSGEFSTSATFVMPYAGHAYYEVTGFDSVKNNDARLIVNGSTIFEDVVQESQNPPINGTLGQFDQGQTLTFTMVHNDGSPWLAWNSGVIEYQCGSWCNIVFSLVPIDLSAGENWPTNICITVSCDHLELLDKINLYTYPEMQSYVFGDLTYMVAWYDFICWSGTKSPPKDATFTFTMTEGQEYAILQDAYGNEGTSLNANYSASQCWVKIKTIGDEPSHPVYVTVEAKTDITPNTVSGRFELRPGDLKIIPTKSVIVYGDTLRFDVWKKLPDGSLSTLAAGTGFEYDLIEGNDAGYLFFPGVPVTSDDIGGKGFPSVIFAAVEESPQGDTTLVKLRVEAGEPDTPPPPPPPCPDCLSGSVKPGDPISVKALPNKRINMQKVSKSVYEMKSLVKHVDQTHVEENVDGSNFYKDSYQTSTQKAQMDIDKSQPKSLQKNANESYSYGYKDEQLKLQYINKATNQTANKPNQSVGKSNQAVLEKNAYGGYSAKAQSQKVSKTESSIASTEDMPTLIGFATIKVIKSCIQAKFKKTPLPLGDTTKLAFTFTETGQPVPPKMLLDVAIENSNGLLLPRSDSSSTMLKGVTQPIKYIAPDSIQGDSLVVNILAVESGTGGTGASASITGMSSVLEGTNTTKNTLHAENTAIKNIKGETITQQSFSPAMIKALQEQMCETKAGVDVAPKLVVTPQGDFIQKILGTDLPTMPKPVIRVQLENYHNDQNGTVNFHYILKIHWKSDVVNHPWGTPKINKDEQYTGDTTGTNDQTINWTLNLDKYGMRGGNDITLIVTATTADGKVYKTNPDSMKNPFLVKGKNPTLATMLAELNGLKYEAIANKESNFNQFSTTLSNEYLKHPHSITPAYPLQGPPTGLGIMQIDPPPNDDIVWNWVSNVNLGKQKLDTCIYIAGTYHTREQFNNDNPQPAPLDSNRQLIQAYCEYNAGYKARYWKWVKPDEKHNISGHWEIDNDGYWLKARPYATDVWVLYVLHTWR